MNDPEQQLPFPAFVDSTMLAAFRSCQTKFNYNFLRNLHADGKSIHLVAGGAFAAGLEAARRKVFTPKALMPEELAALPPLDQDGMILAAFQAFAKSWGTYSYSLDMQKSFVNTFYALDVYLRDYHPLTDFIQPMFDADGIPRVEFSFAIPLPVKHPVTHDPILFTGRFDLLGTWDGVPVVVDEKTTTALGEQWRRQWDMRGQFLGYCWACQQLGYPVTNAVARGTAILKTKVNFMTVPVHFPQHLINRWYDNLIITLHDMIRVWESSIYRMSFGEACNSYGGCPYTMLCTAAEPSRWFNNYTYREWNPLSANSGD